MKKQGYVIIGNSTAAAGCIGAIRKLDMQSPITVVSKEPHHIYSRPLISYLLLGKTDRERMLYRPRDFYEKNRVTLLSGTAAQSIDPQAQRVALADGTILPYDELLVATGSSPFLPPTEGIEQVKKHFTFMTLDDALALQAALSADSRVLIIGAGLIGLKCAEGIRHLVRSIDVVDMAGRILPSILDEDGAKIVQTHLEQQGIRFHLAAKVAQYQGQQALLDNGETIPFDVVVTAVGVRPNVQLVQDAGGEIRRGIATDAFCRTSLPHVYAAGDCAESRDIVSGQERVLALLPNAYMQGECAGYTMAGKPTPYDSAIAMNAIGFFGLHVLSAGNYEGEALTTQGNGRYKKLFVKDGMLNGYILIGNVDRAGIYTALVRNRTPLAEVDFQKMQISPQMIDFSQTVRKAALAAPH